MPTAGLPLKSAIVRCSSVRVLDLRDLAEAHRPALARGDDELLELLRLLDPAREADALLGRPARSAARPERRGSALSTACTTSATETRRRLERDRIELDGELALEPADDRGLGDAGDRAQLAHQVRDRRAA